MKTKTLVRLIAPLALTLAFSLQPSALLAQGTAFTYQGRLNSNGTPASGSYDLVFSLHDAASGGGQVGSAVTNAVTSVSNGLFTATLDFGSGVFTGPGRWLQIEVRTNGAPAYATLSPRQPMTPSPYALYAPSAGAAATATTANGVAAGSVGTAGLAEGAVDSSRIADGTIRTSDHSRWNSRSTVCARCASSR